jgi:protein SCO1/2
MGLALLAAGGAAAPSEKIATTQSSAIKTVSEPCCCCGKHDEAMAEPTTAPSTEPSAMADQSLYLMPDAWQDDKGKTIHFSDLRGRPRAIGMVYTSCQGSCLVTLSHLQEIEASLPKEVRNQIGIVVVTFDPLHDTVDKLAAYRAEHQLPADRWTLLRGSPESTAALAAALQTRYVLHSNRGIVHTAEITILDANGMIVERAAGLHPDMGSLSSALTRCVQEHPVSEADAR